MGASRGAEAEAMGISYDNPYWHAMTVVGGLTEPNPPAILWEFR